MLADPNDESPANVDAAVSSVEMVKKKFKQWWSTKQTITSHLNSLDTKKDHYI
jgi:hypothetical protein